MLQWLHFGHSKNAKCFRWLSRLSPPPVCPLLTLPKPNGFLAKHFDPATNVPLPAMLFAQESSSSLSHILQALIPVAPSQGGDPDCHPCFPDLLLLFPYIIDYLLAYYIFYLFIYSLLSVYLWSKVISVMAGSLFTGALQTCTQCLGCSLMTCGLRRVQHCLHLL